jgi:hypothetical protein
VAYQADGYPVHLDVHVENLFRRVRQTRAAKFSCSSYPMKVHFNIIFSYTPRSCDDCSSHSGFPTNILNVFLRASTRATCPASHSLSDFITLAIRIKTRLIVTSRNASDNPSREQLSRLVSPRRYKSRVSPGDSSFRQIEISELL